MKRDTTLATEVQWTSRFVPPIKTVPRLHFAVSEKRYTWQAIKQALCENNCRVLHKHLTRYKLGDRKLFKFLFKLGKDKFNVTDAYIFQIKAFIIVDLT